MECLEVRTDCARKVVSVSGLDQSEYRHLVGRHLITSAIPEISELGWSLTAVVQTAEQDGYLFYFERRLY